MKTESVIEKQLKQDYDKFVNSVYEGKVPAGIIEQFKRSILYMPPFFHKISFYKVKAIADKTEEQLTYSDLSDIIKVVLNTPLATSLEVGIYDFDEAVEKSIIIDKFAMEFNSKVDGFKQAQEQKKLTLLMLSNKNGSKVISL